MEAEFNEELRMPSGRTRSMFEAPVPGQSLTKEPGKYPWESPPQFNNIDEAMQHYMNRFQDEKVMFNLFSLMEAKVPITTIAESMIMHGFAEGLYTPDVGLLVANDLMEVLVAMAKEAEISYDMGVRDDMSEEYRRAGQLKSVMAEREKEDVTRVKEVIEEAKPEPAPQQGGLMAKAPTPEPQTEKVA
tara:strand:+ start:284 stop:847 length:564 start_codon:yes stop_codon:yes gene_type:complete